MISNQILQFLSSNPDVTIGYSGFKFFKVAELEHGQIGYSNDGEGNSLIDGEKGCWQEEWLVIGTDELIGYPIIIDTGVKHLPVLTAPCGEDEWDPYLIADSLNNFIQIIEQLKILSKDRGNPEALRKKHYTIVETDRFLMSIILNNPYTDIDYWIAVLED